MRKLLGLFLLLVSSVALADTACQEALNTTYNCAVNVGMGAFSGLSWGELVSYAGALLMAMSIFLRLLAEALGWLAEKTKNTWDNRVVHVLMDVVNFLGKLVGWFGGGKPKLVK